MNLFIYYYYYFFNFTFLTIMWVGLLVVGPLCVLVMIFFFVRGVVIASSYGLSIKYGVIIQ